MTTRDKPIDRIAEGLLHYLRSELNDSKTDYDTPLTQIMGVEEYWYSPGKKLDWINEEAEKNYPFPGFCKIQVFQQHHSRDTCSYFLNSCPRSVIGQARADHKRQFEYSFL